jgi:antitoxin (DNA-binding transcriptional repressor) of toxin-antitoxin stability system
MQTIPIHDAKTNLSKYIAAAKRGEQITFGAYGKYEVSLLVEPQRIIDMRPKPGPKKAVRQLGTLRGKVWIAPDAFSEELDQEISDSFEANQELD